MRQFRGNSRQKRRLFPQYPNSQWCSKKPIHHIVLFPNSPKTSSIWQETHLLHHFISKLLKTFWNPNNAIGNPPALLFCPWTSSKPKWHNGNFIHHIISSPNPSKPFWNVQNRTRWQWTQLLPYFFPQTLQILLKLNEILWKPTYHFVSFCLFSSDGGFVFYL